MLERYRRWQTARQERQDAEVIEVIRRLGRASSLDFRRGGLRWDLYLTLDRLERQEKIVSYWESVEGQPRRRFYVLAG